MEDVFVHETALVDEGCTIGAGTGLVILSPHGKAVGEHCSLELNTFIANKKIGIKKSPEQCVYL